MTKVEIAKALVLENIEKMYYTTGNDIYVEVNMGKHNEIVSTGSKKFKHWLIYLFEKKDNSVISDGEVKNVISSVNSVVLFEGDRDEVYLRIAEKDNKIYLDLCNEQRQVLEISAIGTKILNTSPILFRRTDDMAEIPAPIFSDEKDYMKIAKYINCRTKEDLDMIIAFILAAFRPKMPKPILNFTGEAGSGKSMNTRIIRDLIDPAIQKDLLKKEININELSLAAQSQYLMAFDNLSGISKEGSDLLCMVSTGGAITKRKLYTDSDEIIINLKKVVILNGIDEISKRQDLVSRTIFIETPKFKPEKKKTEAEIWKFFKEDYPYILGSLLNAVSIGLRNKEKDTTSYPRMQDFGRFIGNCSEGLDWENGYWQEIYPNNQKIGIEQSISNDLFALELVGLMEDLKLKGRRIWSGTSSDLLKKLSGNLTLEEPSHNKVWPEYNQVKSRLRRISPLLDSKGIRWTHKRSNGKNLITIKI